MAKQDRFRLVLREGNPMTSGVRQIYVDRETGVNYLWVRSGYSGGLTVLLDRDGKPVITPVERQGEPAQ